MELIRQNPYNVVGVLAGASQRMIAKQKAKINAFQKVGKQIKFDTYLKFTGNPDRSNEAIKRAFANIEINHNKLFNALFWFASHNHLDETALAYLKSGEVGKAEDIWRKTIDGKSVSSKNFAGFNNLGTLALATAFSNGSINAESLQEGVRLKTALLTSDSFIDFCHLVADETYTVDGDKELEVFIEALLEEIDRLKVPKADKTLVLVGGIHPKLKSILSAKLTDGPLHDIEHKTSKARRHRSENSKNGLQLGNALYQNTRVHLTTLSEVLGKDDLKYKTIADKLAKEILQCGIDYFKAYQDREEEHGSDGIPQEHAQYVGNAALTDDLGSAVMRLLKMAKSIAAGTQTKERIAENIEGLQEWIDNTAERKKQKLIGEDLAFVALQLERFQRVPDTIENADDLITSCKPKLQNMKSVLGFHDDFYLKISSAVVNNAQGMLVTVINNAQQDPSIRLGVLGNLKEKVSAAIRVSAKLGALDMVPELKAQYDKNHQTLKLISSQISSSATSSSSSSDGGCYIATMAYGSYEHPQVLELRKFRDESLSKSIAGRSLINVYYGVSPRLVKVLKGNAMINSLIRSMLNQVIKYIK